MVHTVIPPISTIPPTPLRSNLATFEGDSENWMTHEETVFGPELNDFAVAANTLGDEMEVMADDAEAAAVAAVAAAAAAAGSAALAGATAWVSGETFGALGTHPGVGDCRYSLVNWQSYRRILAGAGTTDPSLDATNWAPAAAVAGLVRVPRTSNTILGIADKGKWIAATSGSWSQTLASAATCGDGWFVYFGNEGTGEVTLSATIDGLSSFVVYPNEVRIIQCDGTLFKSFVLRGFSYTYTSSGTFTKPPGYKVFQGLMWGGGASGERTDNIIMASRGGAASGAFPFSLLASAFAATETITVGAGGAAVTGVAAGATGGTSSIGSLLTQDGGSQTTGSSTGGASPWAGGNSQASAVGGSAVYGGGGGGSANSSNPGTAYAGGTSKVAGAGGAGGTTTDGTDGTAPGGGGGATKTGTTSGAGARGEVRIWGVA